MNPHIVAAPMNWYIWNSDASQLRKLYMEPCTFFVMDFGNYQYFHWMSWLYSVCFLRIAFAFFVTKNCERTKHFFSRRFHGSVYWLSWTIPSQLSQYFLGGGNTRFLMPFSSVVELDGATACNGLVSDDWMGQSSVSCSSNTSQISQNSLGAGFRLTGMSNIGFLLRMVKDIVNVYTQLKQIQS